MLVKCLMGSQLKRGPTSLLSVLAMGDLTHITANAERTTLQRGYTVDLGGERSTFPNFSNKPPNTTAASLVQAARRPPPLGSGDWKGGSRPPSA